MAGERFNCPFCGHLLPLHEWPSQFCCAKFEEAHKREVEHLHLRKWQEPLTYGENTGVPMGTFNGGSPKPWISEEEMEKMRASRDKEAFAYSPGNFTTLPKSDWHRIGDAGYFYPINPMIFTRGKRHGEKGLARDYLISNEWWHRGYTQGRLEFYRAKWNREREEGAQHGRQVRPGDQEHDTQPRPRDHQGEEA